MLKLPRLGEIADLKRELYRECRVPHTIIVMEVYKNRFHKVFDNNEALASIRDSDVIVAYEQVSPEPVAAPAKRKDGAADDGDGAAKRGAAKGRGRREEAAGDDELIGGPDGDDELLLGDRGGAAGRRRGRRRRGRRRRDADATRRSRRS